MRVNWLVLSFATLCTFTAQAAKVTSLKIEGNTVIFTQSGTKTTASPACAESQPNSWGLQLLTDSDRATYAALVAAAGSNMDIVVTSSQDCVEGTAIERLHSVEVIPAIASTGAGGMRIVASGERSGTTYPNARIYHTETGPDGTPYMVKSGNNVFCQNAATFVSHSLNNDGKPSSKFTLCLAM